MSSDTTTQAIIEAGLERASIKPASPWSADELARRRGHDPNFLGRGIRLPLPEPGADQVWLHYTHFSVLHDPARRQAALTVVDIDGRHLQAIRRRKPDTWYPDPRLSDDEQPERAFFEKPDPAIDVRRNPFAFGHLVRRLDPAWEAPGREGEADLAERDTFHLTNASPQAETLNSGPWNVLEDILLDDLRDGLAVRAVVLTGPVFQEDDHLLHGTFPIPRQYWKVVAWRAGAKLAAAGWRQRQPSEVLPEGLESLDLPFDGKAGHAWLLPIREIAAMSGLDLSPYIAGDTYKVRRAAQRAATAGLESVGPETPVPLPGSAEDLLLAGTLPLDDAAGMPEAALEGLSAALADREAEDFPDDGDEAGLEAIGGTPADAAARVSTRAAELVIRHETGGPDYYERVVRKRPVWPGAASGITIGFGYDLGHVTADELRRDWAALPPADLDALLPCVGRHGNNTDADELQALLGAVRHVRVEWPIAEAVFRASTLPRYAARTDRALPNCEMLPGDAFGALVSLTFNRGASYGAQGERYAEMRAVREAMEARRFAEIPRQIRAMRRIWAGTSIQTEMDRRRENEAALFEAALAAVPAAAVASLAAPSVLAGLESSRPGPAAAARSAIPAGAQTWDGTGDEDHWEQLTEEHFAAAAEDPDSGAFGLESIGATSVMWAPDAESPDYSHLQALSAAPAADFTLAAADLALLASANAFDVGSDTPVLFGLRGAAIVRDHAGGAEPVLRDQRPDHKTPRCVLGVWDRAAQRVSVFPGSTVPDRRAVVTWQTQRTSGNMLATGLYRYVAGVHNSRPGCFLLRDSAGNKRVVVVRRSGDDLAYDLADTADRCAPGDNIHPTFFSAPVDFSSFGCQTVVGSADDAGSHKGPWADFRAAAGMQGGAGTPGRAYLYMLLTGREARLASLLRRQGLAGDSVSVAALRRLRFGSEGDAVRRLQAKLGFSAPDGDFGPATAEALHAFQRKLPPAVRSDGIWSPALDTAFKWNVFAATAGAWGPVARGV